MKPEICALNLVTLDFIYSGIHRLPGLGEEVSTNHLTLSLGGGPNCLPDYSCTAGGNSPAGYLPWTRSL